MDASLLAEVKAWIADDPDPVTASACKNFSMQKMKRHCAFISMVFYSSEQRDYEARMAPVLHV